MTTEDDTYAAMALLVALSDATVPDNADPKGLRLSSKDIGDKFGFNDGDVPDTINVMAQAYYRRYRYVGNDVWHPLLMDLVRTRLLPALGNPHVDGLQLMSTIHNPIRVTSPLPPDFPHGDIHVPWLEVLTKVVMLMPEHDDPDR